MQTIITNTEKQLFAGKNLDRQAASALLDFALQADEQGKGELYALADNVRKHIHGNAFHLCSIINARSGNCTENCRFCSQSARHHTGVSTYTTIPEDEAMMIARDNEQHGVHRLSLVTSGRNLSEQGVHDLSRLFARIGEECSMDFCASAGFLDENIIAGLKKAGVTRYHCNLEANKRFFPEVCTTHTWEEKVATLKLAQEHGLSLCSGGIMGLGETWQDRLDMAFELRELGVESIPINILTAIEGTPMAELPPLTSHEVLTTVALFRLINPQAIIRMAGGRQQLGNEQYRCFTAGANGAIVGNYLTTTGSGIKEDLAQLDALGFDYSRRA